MADKVEMVESDEYLPQIPRLNPLKSSCRDILNTLTKEKGCWVFWTVKSLPQGQDPEKLARAGLFYVGKCALIFYHLQCMYIIGFRMIGILSAP